MKKKVLALTMVLMMGVSMLAACGSKVAEEPKTDESSQETAKTTQAVEEPEVQTEPEGGYKIAVLVKDSVTPFWKYFNDGAKRVGAEVGAEILEFAPLQTQNLEEQVRQVEDAIQQGVDAIVIAPIDSEGIVPAIEKANDAGIPVITSNSKAAGGQIETFIGVDNYEAAKTLAQYMMDELGGKGNVVIIEGNPAGQTSQDRVAGFTEIIEQYPDVELLVSQPAMFNRDQAMTVMENIIQSNDQIDAVMALNDEMALGAHQALQDAGVSGVLITGFDGALEGLEAIQEGVLYASLNQAPHDQGGEAVRAAVAILKGNRVEEWIKVGGNVCDSANAAELLKNFE
jgi:ABC-type sugar transport system, periplasmic component